jgi:hypothetical protein
MRRPGSSVADRPMSPQTQCAPGRTFATSRTAASFGARGVDQLLRVVGVEEGATEAAFAADGAHAA